MIEYNFRPVFYIWSKPYNLVKMVFLAPVFRPLSQEPTHMYIINTVALNNITFVITYTPT